MDKLDFSKQYPDYYSAKTTPSLLEIGATHYLSISGKGDPSGPEFKAHIEALYPVAYTLKFMGKAIQKDFIVPKLEGLWWFDENKFRHISGADAPTNIPRAEWSYRLLIRLPEWVKQKDLETAKQEAALKKPELDISTIDFFEMQEGLSLQILHKGAFDQEPESLLLMHHFMEEQHLERNGYHHEIYLSDFRKTAADKLKTILRQPVKPMNK